MRTAIQNMWIIAALLLLPSAGAYAAPVGSITRVDGGADVLRAGATVPAAVRTGDPVSFGDIVRTKRDGRLEITFLDGSSVQLATESRLRIDEYTYSTGNVRKAGILSLLRGKLRALVSKAAATVMPAGGGAAASNFNIRTPTAVAGVKGTLFIVYYERGVTGVVFVDGSGFMYNPARPDRVVLLTKGQGSFVLGGNEPPTRPQQVAAAVVESQQKETSGKGAGAGNATGGQPGAPGSQAGIAGEILQASTSLETLTGAMAAIADAGSGTVTSAVNLVDPAKMETGPAGGAGTLIPITEAKPALIVSPVTVNVTLPY